MGYEAATLSLYAPKLQNYFMTYTVVQPIVLFILGLLMLNKGSDVFISSAKKISNKLNISTFLIGFFMVAFATSVPEIASTAYASFKNADGVAIGNILGSNIANIALVFALALLFRSSKVTRKERVSTLKHLAITLFCAVIIISGSVISRVEGLVLMVLFFLYAYTEMRNEEHSRHVHLENLGRVEKQFFIFLGGAAIVILGSMILVNSAIELARILHVPQSIIGLTAVAVGTSLPELATSLTAVRKGYYEMAAGELIGSNITNILFALGLAGMISPISVDLPSMMVGMTNVILIGIILVLMGSRKRFTRVEGLILLTIYFEFLWLNYRFV